jgi:CRISPR-associated endonuclease/helicase Cas3
VTAIQVTEEHLLLWGKTCRPADDPQDFASRYHPLLFHLLDVAHTALELWDEVLSETFKRRIAAALRCDLEAARLTAVFLAGVHDLGKATPGFQFREDTPLDWLRELLTRHGFREPTRCENKPHSYVTAKELRCFMRDPTFFWQDSDNRSNRVFAHITGAHHGTFPSSEYGSWGEKEVGDAKWRDARLALLHHLRAALCPKFDFHVSWNECAIGAVPELAGFISVADWIGSSRLFEPVGHRDGGTPSLDDYRQKSISRVRQSLSDFGWKKTPRPSGSRPDFTGFWGFAPNALQEAVEKQTRDVTTPFFLLIEAPMGVGKTEAALWASDAAQAEGVNSGFYVALPTQATSNAMYDRVEKFLLKRYPDEPTIHLQLAHNHASLSDDVKVLDKGLIYDEKCTPEEARVVAASWFCGAKRRLLAPFGVGTIDQSLLAALQARHWFVRMFGLSGKVIVFDEVHAYDTYMSHLLATLLGWLREIGCSVIMLSATLPASRRSELARAWGGELPSEEAAYPRLTWLQGDQQTATSYKIDASDLKKSTVGVRHLRPDDLGRTLRERLQGGGCAAVICNTVAEAQQTFERLRAEVGDIVPEDGWTLFHARMPFGWRQGIEDSVIKRFGKRKAERPRCAVVVATQVIEQSLDLDFDWMASYMAPGDLLLQRAGRLHRHPKDEDGEPIKRPNLLETPELAILCDTVGDEMPSFGLSELVYEREVLLRSWLVWRDRNKVQLPGDIESLVKAVYDDEPRIPDAAWQNALDKALHVAEQKKSRAKDTAKNVVVSARDVNGEPEDPATFVNFPAKPLYDDDDPEVSPQLRAATRDGDPSVTVVCLCRQNGRVYLFDDRGEPDTAQELDLSKEPSPDLTRRLVNLSLPLSNRALFDALAHDKTPERLPPSWKKSPVLRHHRALVFDGDFTTVNGRRLRLDHELGLVIEKEEMAKEEAEP